MNVQKLTIKTETAVHYGMEWENAREVGLEFEWLAEMKLRAQEVVRDKAEECRGKIFTSRPGKIAEYREKARLATLAVAGDQKALSLLSAEAAVRNMTPAELAEAIVTESANSTALAMQIATLEAQGLSQVNAATQPEAVQAALTTFAQNTDNTFNHVGG